MKRLLIVIAALALVTGACGDTASTEVTATQPPGAVSGDTGATTTTTPDDGEATLADYLPFFGPQDPEESEAFYREQERVAQESIATCMAEQGFEYIPFVYEEGFGDPFFDEDMTEEERRAEQGFGMAYYLLFEPEFEDTYEPADDPDPNSKIAQAMSDAERDEYYYALHGEQPDESLYDQFDWDNATEEERMAFEEEMSRLWQDREWKGCMELAYEDVFGGGDQDIWMSFELEFGNWWEEVQQRVDADPRMIELQENWTSCMADAGFEFEDQNDMWMTLDAEFSTIVDWGDEFGHVDDPDITPLMDDQGNPIVNDDGTMTFVDPQGNTYTEEEVNAIYDDLYGPKFDEAELREFLEYEISVALADWECGGDFWELQQEIWQEYETQWVADNKAALDAWKAGREAEG